MVGAVGARLPQGKSGFMADHGRMIAHGMMTLHLLACRRRYRLPAMAASIIKEPAIPARIGCSFGVITRILENKYGFDELYQKLFSPTARWLWAECPAPLRRRRPDRRRLRQRFGEDRGSVLRLMRESQTSPAFHYAFAMIIGLFRAGHLFGLGALTSRDSTEKFMQFCLFNLHAK